MKRHLILIRPAHRESDVPSRDNGLSEKGQAQVKRLVSYLSDRIDGKSARYLSSPKKRCLETLGPIAKEMNAELEVDERLTETSPIETHSQLISRMDEFCDEWRYQGGELTVICSHGDYIPMMVERLTGARIGLKKAGVVEIETLGSDCFLMSLVQKVGD